MTAPIDEKTGIIKFPAMDKKKNIYYEHPMTKTKIVGFKIPKYKEAIKLVKIAAKVIPEIRYVGWDIAITKDGPVIMEGNEYPSYGLVQYYLFNDEHEGHLAQISKILGEDYKRSAKKKIDYIILEFKQRKKAISFTSIEKSSKSR